MSPRQRETAALRIEGSLVYDDASSMYDALEVFDAKPYVGVPGSRLFLRDGVKIEVDHRGEIDDPGSSSRWADQDGSVRCM